MNKKGQIGIKEIGLLIAAFVIIVFVLPLITMISNAAQSGNIDAMVNALIPMIIFAVIVAFIGRLFR